MADGLNPDTPLTRDGFDAAMRFIRDTTLQMCWRCGGSGLKSSEPWGICGVCGSSGVLRKYPEPEGGSSDES